MGGSNEASNLVKVNIAMHAFLHKCLYDEYGHWEDNLAYMMLSGQADEQYAARMKRAYSNKERVWSEESKAKVGNANRGKTPWNVNVPRTDEERQKMSANRKGKGRQPKSPETKKKMAEARAQYWAKKKGLI